jgi:hypothetical protein
MKSDKMLLSVGTDGKGLYHIFNGRKYRLKRTELHRNENSALFDIVYIYEPDEDIVDSGEDEKPNA